MNNNLVERIAEHYYINSDDYESLTDCVNKVADKADLPPDWIEENIDEIHFVASFLEFEFTKDTVEVYEETNNTERSPESVIKAYNLNSGLFKALLRDE